METVGTNDLTVLDALYRHLAINPGAPAYRSGDKVLTFAEVERATNQIANAFAAMRGVRPWASAMRRKASHTRHAMTGDRPVSDRCNSGLRSTGHFRP